MGRSDELGNLAALLRTQRWASLATTNADGQPSASMVAYAVEPDFKGVLLHLSRLAEHTGNLLERPMAALAISEPDPGTGDPQQLARVSLQGPVETVGRESRGFAAARDIYLARLPTAAPLFDFPDFVLFRLRSEKARFVGGFARAHSYGAADLQRLAGNDR